MPHGRAEASDGSRERLTDRGVGRCARRRSGEGWQPAEVSPAREGTRCSLNRGLIPGAAWKRSRRGLSARGRSRWPCPAHPPSAIPGGGAPPGRGPSLRRPPEAPGGRAGSLRPAPRPGLRLEAGLPAPGSCKPATVLCPGWAQSDRPGVESAAPAVGMARRGAPSPDAARVQAAHRWPSSKPPWREKRVVPHRAAGLETGLCHRFGGGQQTTPLFRGAGFA